MAMPTKTAPSRIVDVVVVTGMSGSGKSTAISAFEDAGYYCIDNLPTALLPRFIELCVETGVGMSKVALGIDLRDEAYVRSWESVRREVEAAGHHVFLIFVDADDHVLIHRFPKHGGATRSNVAAGSRKL